MRFKVAAPAVVSEEIGGEVIAIHLDKGHYYALPGPAALVWSAIGRGESAAAMAAALNRHYDTSERAAMQAVEAFLDELTREGLVVEAESAATQLAAPADEPTRDRPPLPELAFERYTDMEAFLLVDPIHEVDVTADWPAHPDPPEGSAGEGPDTE